MCSIKYETVDSSETDVSELDATKSSDLNHEIEESSRYKGLITTHQKLLLWLNGLIFGVSLYMFFITAVLIRSSNDEPNDLLRKTSEHSPIFDQIEIPLITKKMNATLLEPDPLPIYRRPPSPEVDAAWNRLANIKPIVISRSDVIQLGRDPTVAAKWPESFGFGSDAYIGRIDVFHQIHCLDWLRREANFDHYYGRKWPPGTTASDMHRTHVSHCIYLLLQNLMCNANVDIYTHYWADAQLNAFPDFSVNHKCRDFDAILEWQEDNSIDVDLFGAIRKPLDYEAKIMSHRFKELFGWFDLNPDDGSDSGEIG